MITIKALKRIISALCVSALAISFSYPLSLAQEASGKVTIYVAPNGSDTASGTIDHPLASLKGAKNKITAERQSGATEFEIIFRGGEYRMTEEVTFYAEDSGTAQKPIVYRAMDGEKPVFKMSAELKNPTYSPVTNETMLKRIKKDMLDKIVAIDLLPYMSQSQIRNNVDMAATLDWFDNGEPNHLYIDGKEQTIAEWPNGDGNYVRWTKSDGHRTIYFDENDPIYWTNAKDWWITGYQDWDWRFSRVSGVSVDPVAKSLTMADLNGNMYATSYQSKRWKAKNLAEEIDLPGEFYIDRENMTLYLYPPYSLDNSTLELSLANRGFMNIIRASNITFQGLEFTQCTAEGIYLEDVDNIDFLGCSFTNMASRGLAYEGSKWAETDKLFWQRMKADASYNCDIKDCLFYNIGDFGIDMEGGNQDTLRSSNNVIENNMFYMVAMTNKCSYGIYLQGVGHKVLHNNMSRIPHHAITYRGNDMEFKYNEIHDVIQETDDCGAIYTGRNALHRNDVIEYNYLHDLGSVEKLTFGHQCAIYWDDRHVGQVARKNIIKNVNKNVYTNGVDNYFSDNTSINILLGDMDIKNGGASPNSESYPPYGFYSSMANPELYYEKYPTMREVMRIMDEDGNMHESLAKFNIVKGNLAVNSADLIIGTNTTTYGQYSGNGHMDNCDDFVDPENQDFRLKSGSPTALAYPGLLDDTFDIELIGLQREVTLNKETSPFRQLYPQNGATAVPTNGLEFAWEDAFGASKYRLIIATDREMQNIVYDENADWTVKAVDGLEKNKIYYWKVYAINRSRELNSTWESISPTFTFSTAIYEPINTDYYNNVVGLVQEQAKGIEEGEKVGDYLIGTKTRLESLIKRAYTIGHLRLGAVSQAKFDSMATSIGKFFEQANMVNKGVYDLKTYTVDPELWGGRYAHNQGVYTGISSVIDDGYSLFSTKGADRMAGSVIYSFDAKLNVLEDFIDMGINKEPLSPQWISSNLGYSLVIKPDVIELQRANGSTHALLTEVPYSIDNEWHRFDWGWIDIGIANLVVFYIDGEPIIEYQDVQDQVKNATGNLCFLYYNNKKDSVQIRATENPMSTDEYEKIVEKNSYRAAKAIRNTIDTSNSASKELTFIRKNGSKVVTEDKVIDISGSPVVSYNNSYMVPLSKLADIIGGTVTQNGSQYVVGWEGKTVTLSGSDIVTLSGTQMTSIDNVLKGLDRNYVKEDHLGMFIIGDIVTMNNVRGIGNMGILMDYLDTLEGGYDVDYK